MRRRRKTLFRVDERDFGEAARTIFGSREEMRETFREWEAALVKTIHDACERAGQKPAACEPAASFTKTP